MEIKECNLDNQLKKKLKGTLENININKIITYQNLQDITKVVFRRKFIVINSKQPNFTLQGIKNKNKLSPKLGFPGGSDSKESACNTGDLYI